MRKAQLTIEYIVILVIMLLLFNMITLDLVNSSMLDVTFIQTSEMVNSTRILLSDAAKIINLQGTGAKKTVSVRAPPDCDYVISSNVIYLTCTSGSPSEKAGFNGLIVSPSDVPTKIIFSIPGERIISGELGTITVQKV